MRSEVQEMASDLEIFEPGTEEYKELRRKLEITSARVRLQEEYAQRVVREEQSGLRRTLFNKIMDATRAYAEQEGWDVVLIDDSGEDANDQMNDQQFGAYIATRSVAYRNDRVDITDAVATLMNNAFRNNVSP
jgi:Skp family chaperone for outer membrane proteins